MYQDKYIEQQVIGRGKYGNHFFYFHYLKGVVCAVTLKDSEDKTLYAAKKIRMSGLNEKEKESQLKELNILQTLKHPSIVQLIDFFSDEDTLILVMEYCQSIPLLIPHILIIEGDLFQLIKQRKEQNKQGFPEKIVVQWLIQLLMALQYLHARKIIHRDLKCQNIFIHKNGQLKIGDFGISKMLENTPDKAQTFIGSPYYLSPELCAGKEYNFKTDIWSLGCILHELCTLQHAFDGQNLGEIIANIENEKLNTTIDATRYSKDLLQIASQMLTKDDVNRPTCNDLLGDNYILTIIGDLFSPQKKEYPQVKKNKKIELKQVEEQDAKNIQQYNNSPDVYSTPEKQNHVLKQWKKDNIVQQSNEKQEKKIEKVEEEIKEKIEDQGYDQINLNKNGGQNVGKIEKRKPPLIQEPQKMGEVTLLEKNAQKKYLDQMVVIKEHKNKDKALIPKQKLGKVTFRQEKIVKKLASYKDYVREALEQVKNSKQEVVEKEQNDKKKDYDVSQRLLQKVERFLDASDFNQNDEESTVKSEFEQTNNKTLNFEFEDGQQVLPEEINLEEEQKQQEEIVEELYNLSDSEVI